MGRRYTVSKCDHVWVLLYDILEIGRAPQRKKQCVTVHKVSKEVLADLKSRLEDERAKWKQDFFYCKNPTVCPDSSIVYYVTIQN